MSLHCGFIVEVKDLKEHPNADKLQIATFFGEDVIVGLDTHLGDIGIYFPCDIQLSPEYCEYNHLCRKKLDGAPDTGYMDPDKRNVTAIKLRGEKSYGIYAPLNSLDYLKINLSKLKIGDTITTLEGHEICKKYIPRSQKKNIGNINKKTKLKKKKIEIAPLLVEHADTEQLAYNLNAFKPGDEIEITLKMHGTSGRTAYVPVAKELKGDNILAKIGLKINPYQKLGKIKTWLYQYGQEHFKVQYGYDYVSGTRRTVLENFDGGFYGSNEFRKPFHDLLKGKLLKGIEIYYEIVGFTTNGTPIMSVADNKKMKDKEFIKTYGPTTTFSYGCLPQGDPQSEMYVYRMTLTNEDGDLFDLSPDYMRKYCEKFNLKTVPLLWKGTIPSQEELGDKTAGEWVKDLAEQFYDGADPIGIVHIREGVVVRILNREKFTAFKHKNFSFKVLEGIIKESAESPDLEEMEDLIENN